MHNVLDAKGVWKVFYSRKCKDGVYTLITHQQKSSFAQKMLQGTTPIGGPGSWQDLPSFIKDTMWRHRRQARHVAGCEDTPAVEGADHYT